LTVKSRFAKMQPIKQRKTRKTKHRLKRMPQQNVKETQLLPKKEQSKTRKTLLNE
jgi:hypothetical protein